MGKARRAHDAATKEAMHDKRRRLEEMNGILDDRLSSALCKAEKKVKLLAKEKSKHKKTKSDAFFGARMARLGKDAREDTKSRRWTDADMCYEGVEVAVVVRGCITGDFLAGLVKEIPTKWEPLQLDLKVLTERGLPATNVRLEAKGNLRQTKGAPSPPFHFSPPLPFLRRLIRRPIVVDAERGIRQHR